MPQSRFIAGAATYPIMLCYIKITHCIPRLLFARNNKRVLSALGKTTRNEPSETGKTLIKKWSKMMPPKAKLLIRIEVWQYQTAAPDLGRPTAVVCSRPIHTY